MINILIVNSNLHQLSFLLISLQRNNMPIQTQQQKRKAIYSMKQDLELISCLTQQQIEIDNNHVPKRIKTAGQLSNVLSMKNKQLFFLERKYNFQKEQAKLTNRNHTKMNDFDIHSIKVSEEKDRILEEILKKSKENTKQKDKQQASMNLIEELNSVKPQENMDGAPILQYFQLVGLRQLADSLKISSINNAENIEDLINCLKIISNEDQQRQIIGKEPYSREKIENIQNHKQTFRFILRTRTQNHQLPLISLLQNQKVKQKLQFSDSFLFLLSIMKAFFKNSTYNYKKCLNEQQSFFQNISLFDDKIMIQSDRYNQQLFWQKICNLFLAGPSEYYHIEYLLNYRKQFGILNYFKCLLEKEQATFQQSKSLMATNHHYKQFVIMLKGEYLQYSLKNLNQDEEKLLMIAIRQAIFLRQLSLPRDFHLQFLKKAGEKKIQSIKISLISNQSETSLRKEVTKLFILGQYWRVIAIYCDSGKISYLQALWLWGSIAEIDYKHSTILMYKHRKTCSLFKRKLLKTIQQIKSNHEIQSYYLLLKILKPCWLHDNLDKAYTINLVTSNKLLLQYLVETIGCQSFLISFQLDISDLNSIINQSIENYQDYAYCYQFTLSSVLTLEDLPIIVFKKRQQSQLSKVRPIRQPRLSHVIYNVGKKYNQFEKLYLNIFSQSTQKFLQQNRNKRFSIFRNGFISLIKTNLFLLQNYKICEKKYQQISYINKIYKSLSTSLAKKKIIKQLKNQDPIQIQKQQKQIDILVDILILCSNMLKIRNSIRNRQFQYIVQSYNAILEDISDNFSLTLTHLQTFLDDPNDSINIVYTFISDIIQSLNYLRQSKPKVIRSNSRNIRRFCKEIHSFTKQIKFRKGQGNLLSQQLQKFIRDIDA